MSATGAHRIGAASEGAHCGPVKDGCITCGDVALPLTVTSESADGLARCVDDEGREEVVEVTLVAPVMPGDRVLAHAGTALARLDESGP